MPRTLTRTGPRAAADDAPAQAAAMRNHGAVTAAPDALPSDLTTLSAAQARLWPQEAFPVRRLLPTRWSDDDTYGHVNNTVHYLLFDTAVNGWLIQASGTEIRELPAIGLVVETSCTYFGELRFPETITAGLALEKLGKSSVVYRLALYGEGKEAPAAVGRFVHVYTDRETRRPVAIPLPVREALAELLSASPCFVS
jgi:acyl-CoA thioester hydrolase